MNTKAGFNGARDDFMNAIMETDQYKALCAELHAKYENQMVNDDYPDPYWDEFNDQYERLVVGLLNASITPTYGIDPLDIKIRELFERLNYNGPFEVLFESVMKALEEGLSEPKLRKELISVMTVDMLEEIIQFESGH